MRILAIYRHYWPDTTPYARLLRAILEDLVEQGHGATVFTAQPGYNDVQHPRQPNRQTVGGVDVLRIDLLPERKAWTLLRAVNFALFLLRAIAHVLFAPRYDLVIANGHPPVLMGVALRWIKWLTGTPYLYHLQDIHPESAAVAGQANSGPLARWLLREDIASCRAADCIVTLSADMRQTLLDRPGGEIAAERIHTINNFPLDVYHPVRSDELPARFRSRSADRFCVLFAGNMGHYQQLDRVIEAARLLADNDQIQFVFMGAGAVRNALEAQAGELVGRTVFFEPHQAVEVAFACMKRCDLGLVSLAPGVYRLAYPSKTMTYLAAGLPVLAIVEAESDVATEIQRNAFGYASGGTEPAEIAAAIEAAFRERESWTPNRRAELIARAEAHFGRAQALAAWRALIESVLDLNETEGVHRKRRQARAA